MWFRVFTLPREVKHAPWKSRKLVPQFEPSLEQKFEQSQHVRSYRSRISSDNDSDESECEIVTPQEQARLREVPTLIVKESDPER
jgi:hypothetical protein